MKDENKEQAKEFYKQGKYFFKKEQYKKAIKCFNSITYNLHL